MQEAQEAHQLLMMLKFLHTQKAEQVAVRVAQEFQI
jgi:hypothetical protein